MPLFELFKNKILQTLYYVMFSSNLTKYDLGQKSKIEAREWRKSDESDPIHNQKTLSSNEGKGFGLSLGYKYNIVFENRWKTGSR